MVCRVCGNKTLYKAMDFGNQKLTGVFPDNQDSMEKLSSGVISLVKCDDESNDEFCGLLQIENSFDPDEMYGDTYGYCSSLNPSMVSHLQSKIDKITQNNNLN